MHLSAIIICFTLIYCSYSEFRDPYDFQPETEANENGICPKCKCDTKDDFQLRKKNLFQSSDAFVLLAKTIFQQLKIGTNYYSMHFKITEQESIDINTFPSENFNNHAALNVLNWKFRNSIKVEYEDKSTYYHVIREFCVSVLPIFIFVLACVVAGFSLLTIFRRATKFYLFVSSFIVIFLLSFVQQLFYLYKIELTKHSKDIPAACQNGATKSSMEAVFSFATSFFTIERDECAVYRQDALIHPIFKVNPLAAFTSAVMTVFTTPMTIIASALNDCIKKFTAGIPITYLAPIAISTILVFLSTMVIRRGYTFRSLLFTIEPQKRDHCRSPTTNSHRAHRRALDDSFNKRSIRYQEHKPIFRKRNIYGHRTLSTKRYVRSQSPKLQQIE